LPQKQGAERRENMKFLTISTFKDSMSTLPPAMTRPIVEAMRAWMNQQKQAGKILEAYVIPAWKRGVVISEFDSAEEITQFLPQMPGFGFMDFELYPLADFDEGVKHFIEALKRAEQSAPK
jgi:muconolactone delta-isomerase